VILAHKIAPDPNDRQATHFTEIAKNHGVIVIEDLNVRGV